MNESYNEKSERFIDQNDLIIIENTLKWKPSNEQVKAYADQLEFDVYNDPPEVFEIAYNYLDQPIPDNWRRAYIKGSYQLVYIDLSNNEIHLDTEIEAMAREEYLQFMEEYEEMIKRESMKVTVVPRKKIPPIGKNKEKEDIYMLREKVTMRNIRDNVDREKLEEDEEMKKFKEKIDKDNKREMNMNMNVNVNDTQGNEKDVNTSNKKENKGEFQLNKNEKENNNESYSEFDDSGDDCKIIQIDELDKYQITEEDKDYLHIKSNNIFSDKSLNEKKDKSVNISIKDDDNQLGNSIIEESDNIKEKFEYKKEAITKYKAEKEKIKNELHNIKNKFKDEYETQLNEAKKAIVIEYKKKLEQLKCNLNKSYKGKIEDYKINLTKDYITQKFTILTDKYNTQINQLEIERQTLISKINALKLLKVKSQSEQKEKARAKLNQSNIFINEIKNKKLENINKQYEYNIKQIESKYENDFNSEKIKIEKNFIESQIKLSPNISLSHKNLMVEYEQTLNQRFEQEKSNIKKKFDLKKSNDVEEFKNTSIYESSDKKKFFIKEMANLEKDFLISVSDIRKKSESMRTQSESVILNKLNEISNLFEILKKDINIAQSNEIKEININIQHFIRRDKGEITLEQLEEKIVEYLDNRLYDKIIKMDKLRAFYEIKEKDYKKNLILLKYYIDINLYLNKTLIEKPLFNEENYIDDNLNKVSDMMINDIKKYAKEKIDYYRNENNNAKENKLFPFIDFYLSKIKPYNNNMYKTFDNNNNNYSKNFNQNSFLNFSYLNQFTLKKNNYLTQNNSNNNKVDSFQSTQNKMNTHFQNTSNLFPTNENFFPYNNIFNTVSKPIKLIHSENKKFQNIENIQISNQQSIKLPNEITSLLSEEDLNKYNKISNFMDSEESNLNKEINKITNFRNLSSQLDEMNQNGEFVLLNEAFNEQKTNTIKDEKMLNNKIDKFKKIKTQIEDSFYFIIQNSTRKNIIKDKFDLILKTIDDYKKNIEFSKNSSLNNLSISNEASISINRKIPTKTKQNNSQNINVNNLNYNYSNFFEFYTLYNSSSLNESLLTNYTHEFFNTKKNREIVNYRVRTNLNYTSNINPIKNFFFNNNNDK